LRGLIGTFDIIHDLVQVYYDSQSVTHLAKDHMYHKRVKHVDVTCNRIHHWVVVENIIDLVKISTKNNSADMMTETVPVEKCKASLNFINVLQR